MQERNGAVTFQGKPMTLMGHEIRQGEQAPDVEVLDNNLMPVKLSKFRGKVCIICSVPSLDTPVCDMQTRRFNEEAIKLNPELVLLTISMDLPFAQKRWCGAAHASRVSTFSDHRDASFGNAFGLLIKEWRLLGRAVFVVDQKGIVRHVQYIKEITEQPNYVLVLEEVQKLLK